MGLLSFVPDETTQIIQLGLHRAALGPGLSQLLPSSLKGFGQERALRPADQGGHLTGQLLLQSLFQGFLDLRATVQP